MSDMQGYPNYTPSSNQRIGARLRILGGVVAVSFAVTLAAVVGQRLGEEAMAVIAGVVCGVGASIPTSLLIVWMTRRRHEQASLPPSPGTYPPVVIVQQPMVPGVPYAHQVGAPASWTVPSAPRAFSVVGGEIEEGQYGSYQ
ncbi:MAG: hypothetical protein JW900_02105 [Anaerolineae bacterium]|nr:hypothetical protein [Anaerolineae bacterium]